MSGNIERLIGAIDELIVEIRALNAQQRVREVAAELNSSYGHNAHVPGPELAVIEGQAHLSPPPGTTGRALAIWNDEPIGRQPHCRDDLECYEDWGPEGV